MAHKKASGSSDNGRDSNSKRLGVKLYGGQAARAGNIIIRQRGSKFHLGENTYYGKDWTVHAKIDGQVSYRKGFKNRVFVSVLPFEEVAETVAPSKPAKPKPTKGPKPVEPVKAPAAAAPEATETAVKEPTAATPEPAAEPVKKPAATTPKSEAKPKTKSDEKPDKLTKIEGIGPKISDLLNNAGITTFAALASTDAERIKEILAEAGNRFKRHDPTTWPKQADFAAKGMWDELKKWQDELDGGRPA